MADTFFLPVTIGEDQFDFEHLRPFTMSFHSQKAKRNLKVNVRFSNHCFTQSPNEGETYHPSQVLVDHNGNSRVFCPIRYRLSFDLGSIVRSLNNPACKVFETASRRNYNYSIQIDDPAGPYHLFFAVKRANGPTRKMQDLSLFVESAYNEMPIGNSPSLIGRISFHLLCTKVYLGQPVSTRR